MFKEKPKGCLGGTKMKGQASLLPSPCARAEHVRNVVSTAAQQPAAHVKPSGRSAFIIHHATLTFLYTHTLTLRLDQVQGAGL